MNHIYECRILIIDDNIQLLDMLCSILKKEGYQALRTAASCREARKAFSSEAPDLIILDVMLPDGDGFSLFQEFRADTDIPILFLSARDQDNDRLLGLGLGADDYLTKPFLPKELTLRLAAIRDSGNRLTEPFSGEPAAVADLRTVQELLTAEEIAAALRPDQVGSGGMQQLRLIPCRTACGAGAMIAFHPDRLVLEGEEGCLTVEEIWIAVSVDPVGSGDFSLLLPAAFSGLPIKEGTGCLQASQS